MSEIVIGICDDEPEVIGILRENIESVLNDIAVYKCKILEYTSPLKLLNEIDNINILFLDVEMAEMDGMEVGKKVMRLNPDCKIIIATSRVDRFKEAFRFNTFRFITKPFPSNEVGVALIEALSNESEENEIEVFKNRVGVKIKEKDIIFIQAYNGYIEIYARDNSFRKDISLNNIETQLNEKYFFRINRQCIINFEYVESYSNNQIKICGHNISISTRKKRDFIERYMEFDLNYR